MSPSKVRSERRTGVSLAKVNGEEQVRENQGGSIAWWTWAGVPWLKGSDPSSFLSWWGMPAHGRFYRFLCF